MPESKLVKKYVNKNIATCKSLYKLQESCTAFEEKHTNVNIGFSKFCTLRPKWYVLADSEITHSICVFSPHQNVVLPVDAMGLDIQIPTQINFVLPYVFPVKLICDHFYINIIHKSIFFNWKITSSPYLEMLLISMIKLLFLFFLSDRNVRCCFL